MPTPTPTEDNRVTIAAAVVGSVGGIALVLLVWRRRAVAAAAHAASPMKEEYDADARAGAALPATAYTRLGE